MKSEVPIHARILQLSLPIVLTAGLINVYAQSGPVISVAASAPQATTADLTETKPTFTPDPNAPKYKLIFPTDYDLKFYSIGKKEKVHPTETEASGLAKFIDQLNEAGAKGYRLISAVGESMAIVKLGNTQYEYAGFDLVTHYYTAAPGFPEKYAPLAKKGFRLAVQPIIRFDCLSSSADEDNDCDFTNFFILEKEKGVEKAIGFKYILPTAEGKRDVTMSAAFNETLAAGSYPTNVLSRYEVLFEQNTGSDPRFVDKTDVQVALASLSYWGGDDLPTKVKLLADQGYRLASINYQLAVMYRPRGAAPPVSYVWLEMGKRNWINRRKQRDFQKKLAKLQESGAIYRMAYSNGLGDVNQLIFEEKVIGSDKRREYRVLKFKLRAEENVPARKMVVELTPPSKEALEEMNRLVREGYEVRDLFVTDEVCVLLERNAARSIK